MPEYPDPKKFISEDNEFFFPFKLASGGEVHARFSTSVCQQRIEQLFRIEDVFNSLVPIFEGDADDAAEKVQRRVDHARNMINASDTQNVLSVRQRRDLIEVLELAEVELAEGIPRRSISGLPTVLASAARSLIIQTARACSERDAVIPAPLREARQ